MMFLDSLDDNVNYSEHLKQQGTCLPLGAHAHNSACWRSNKHDPFFSQSFCKFRVFAQKAITEIGWMSDRYPTRVLELIITRGVRPTENSKLFTHQVTRVSSISNLPEHHYDGKLQLSCPYEAAVGKRRLGV